MLILINISVVSKKHRGMGVFTKQIIKELVRNKNNEYVFVSGNDIDKEIMELLIHEKCLFQQINSPLPLFEQVILPFLIFKFKPDICWFPSNTFPIIKFSKKIKYIATIHDMIFFNNMIKPKKLYQKIGQLYRKYNIKFGVSNLDTITSVSNTSLKEIENHFNLNIYDNKYVLYNNFSPIEKEDSNILKKFELYDKKYFYSIAGVAVHKNMDLLIKSFLRFSKEYKEYKLVISGASTSNYVDKYENIIFTDYILDPEKISLIKNAELFIFPSLIEGFGIPLIEGLYYNKNVLVSDIEIFREIGLNYVNYFNPYNESFLIDYFSTDKKKINHVEAKQYIEKSFNILNTTKKLENIFNEFK